MNRPFPETPVASKELSPAVYLRSAVLAQRIYPSGSSIVERAVGQTMIAVENAFKGSSRLVLTDRQGRLFVNGREEPDASVLAGVLQEQGVQSLQLLPGVTGAEVTVLVRLLGRRRSDGGSFADILARENLPHVQAGQVKVVELEDGEVVTRKVNTLLDQVRDFPGLVGSLSEAYRMIDQMPTEAKQAELKGQVVGKMAAMPAHLLRDLFENPLPKRMEDDSLRDGVLKKMTQEKVHDIFSEIGQWYEGIRKTASSDFAAMERLNQLKSFLGKLLGSPASRHVPFAIYEELLQKGLISSIPEGVRRQPEEEPLAAQVDRLMGGPATALLESPSREKLSAVFDKLCAVGLFDLAQGLLGKLLDNFYQESALLRQLAARTGRSLLETLWRSRLPALGDHLFETLRRQCEAERSREPYVELADALAAVAVRSLVEGKTEQALELAFLLRRHQEDIFPFLPARNDVARDALAKAARQSMDVLVEGLLSTDAARAADARRVLNALGRAAAPALVEAVKRATDQRTRRSACMALKEMGEPGAQALAAELTPGLSSPVLLNLMSVAEDFPSAALLNALKGLQHFPDGFVRARIVQLLARIETDEARGAMTVFLEDAEESVQLEAVRALGESLHRPAVPALTKMLPGGSVLRREEICIALGKIADDSVVPALMDVLASRAGLFSRRGGAEETVRVRAAWALANVKTSLGRRELKKLLEDGNAQVRLTARQAMEG